MLEQGEFKEVIDAMQRASSEIDRCLNEGGELVIIPFESATIAIGGVLNGALSESDLKRFAELETLADRGFPENFSNLDNVEDEYIPLEDRLDLPSEPDKNVGFTFVGNDTWLPKPLYEARKRQRTAAARKNERAAVWTR